MFSEGQNNAQVAKRLRVGVRSVRRWRRAWMCGGEPALRSKGSPGRPKLDDTMFAALEAELAEGTVAQGWPDPTRTGSIGDL